MTAEKKRGRGGGNAAVKRGSALGGGVLVMSNCRLAAAGCRGIAEYSATRVRLLLREFELTVEGAGLTVRTYCGDEIEVRGRIDAVLFGNGYKEERDG